MLTALITTGASLFWFVGTCITSAVCVRKFKAAGSYEGEGYMVVAVGSVLIWPLVAGTFIAMYVMEAGERRLKEEGERAKEREVARKRAAELEQEFGDETKALISRVDSELQSMRPNPSAPARIGWPKWKK